MLPILAISATKKLLLCDYFHCNHEKWLEIIIIINKNHCSQCSCIYFWSWNAFQRRICVGKLFYNDYIKNILQFFFFIQGLWFSVWRRWFSVLQAEKSSALQLLLCCWDWWLDSVIQTLFFHIAINSNSSFATNCLIRKRAPSAFAVFCGLFYFVYFVRCPKIRWILDLFSSMRCIWIREGKVHSLGFCTPFKER